MAEEGVHSDVEMSDEENAANSLSHGTVEEAGRKIHDLTGHETPSFDEPLDPEIWEVDYTNTRLRAFPKNILPLQKLEVLILRMNLLTSDMMSTALEQLTPSLTQLDLYDNQMRSVPPAMSRLTNLTNLDISFNKIKSMEHISLLTKLTELYFANNRVSLISNELVPLTGLTTLELGSNGLRTIENIGTLTCLQNLWLGRNKITRIQGLETFVNLRRLDLQNNRLTKIENLNHLVNLKELYLAHNGVKTIEGLDELTSLETLDVSSNFISQLRNLQKLQSLEEFWCNNNKIDSWFEVDHLTCLKSLVTVYLEGNPIAGTEDSASYRNRVANMLPKLTQLDALPVQRSRLVV